MAGVDVDDTSPLIHYNGSWAPITSAQSASPHGFNHSAHLTRVVGDSASFTFNGTSVSVFGTIQPSTNTVSSYSIDSGAAVNYSAPVDTSSIAQFLQTFYQSGPINPGQHTLEIKFIGGDWFWLDYIHYTEIAAASTPVSSTNAATPPPSTPSGSSASPLLPTPTSLPAPSGSSDSPSGPAESQTLSPSQTSVASPSNSSSSTGAIVGGVLGALALIVLLALAVVFALWSRRHHRRNHAPVMLETPMPTPDVSPYTQYAQQSSGSSPSIPQSGRAVSEKPRFLVATMPSTPGISYSSPARSGSRSAYSRSEAAYSDAPPEYHTHS